jgi:hypothetical protein
VLSDGWVGRATHLRASIRPLRRCWIESCDFVRGALIARGILGRGWWDRDRNSCTKASPVLANAVPSLHSGNDRRRA